MGSSKVIPASASPHPQPYRDDPDQENAASSSSAIFMSDVDAYPDEELPAYSDEPEVFAGIPHGSISSPAQQTPARSNGYPEPIDDIAAFTPPSVPFSNRDSWNQTRWTWYPEYSTRADTLEDMIKCQALYPPTYHLLISGTHTETTHNGKKEMKNTITDFFITLNMTNLLTLTPGRGDAYQQIELLAEGKRGYRGGVFPSKRPGFSDVDGEQRADGLRAWCEKFVSDRSKVKAFTLKKEVINHDTKRLEQLVRSMVAATNYRGHLSISFKVQDNEIVVFSPGRLNEWRTVRWLRWFFYLTFLWIISWPVLYLTTKKYEVVKAVYPYSTQEEGRSPKPVVMSEMDFFLRWESTLRRGVLNKFEGFMDEAFRQSTLDAEARGLFNFQGFRSTGNDTVDGAMGLLGAGARLLEDMRNSRGWGGDC